MSLLDATIAAREDGIQRADDHAVPDWKDVALATVRWCAQRYERFTADEVWLAIPVGSPDTHEPAALGPVFRRAASLGYIEKTEDKRKVSILPQRHRQDITIWKSLLGGTLDCERPDVQTALGPAPAPTPLLARVPMAAPEGQRWYWDRGWPRFGYQSSTVPLTIELGTRAYRCLIIEDRDGRDVEGLLELWASDKLDAQRSLEKRLADLQRLEDEIMAELGDA